MAAEATEGWCCFMADDIILGWDIKTLLMTLEA